MINFKEDSKAYILKNLIYSLDGTGMFNENTINILKENLESVFDCYRDHEELTNSDITVLIAMLLNISRRGKKIRDGKKYADFTAQRYLELIDYYMKVNSVNSEIDPYAKAGAKIMDEILDILKNENSAEYEN